MKAGPGRAAGPKANKECKIQPECPGISPFMPLFCAYPYCLFSSPIRPNFPFCPDHAETTHDRMRRLRMIVHGFVKPFASGIFWETL